ARVPVLVRSESPQWTVGDPEELRRAVSNLVDNAVRHARSTVVLATDPGGLVTVTDDGPGIQAGDRERVFDRLTRLDDARARQDHCRALTPVLMRSPSGPSSQVRGS